MSDGLIGRRRFCAAASAGAAMLAFGPVSAKPAAEANPGRPIPEAIGHMRRHVASREDTLIELARQYNLGFTELAAANRGVDPWIPGEGTEILLPTLHVLPTGPRKGIVINLADQRLYYFPAGSDIESYPIGTGREAWETPKGETRIVRKQANPNWYPPASVRKENPELPAVVRPGPDNPLGSFALYLGWPAYLIHGTNKPYGVGRRVSHGCIRLYPEDISQLFPRLPIGTPVTIISQEAKIGRHRGELLLEIHPNPQQSDELEVEGAFAFAEVPELAYRVSQAAGPQAGQIDWPVVRRAEAERTGVPIPILKPERSASSED